VAGRPEARPAAVEQEWLTLGEAARFLGVAQSTIRKWSDHGRLAAFYTPGGHRRFRRAELEAFVERSAPIGQRARRLVLVIDDDAALRQLVRAAFELAGYAVAEAGSGEQALQAIAEQPPELVLLDLVMPGVEGWQLLRELDERHGSIPVIVFSGKVEREQEAEAAEQGARGFVGKPFDPDELLERARKLAPA
jgi:excisionase family DNA binding protein